MQIRNRLYPYPVLAYFLDSYKSTSTFTVTPQLIIEGYRQKIKFEIALNNSELLEMIRNEKAEIVLHMECSQTGYRHYYVVPDDLQSYEFVIPDEKISGKLQVCPYILAKESISDFSNEDFNDDYSGMTFEIERGNILAIAKQMDVKVKKKTDDLRNLQSIINVVENADRSQDYMVVDYDGSLINVLLPNQEWSRFSALNTGKKLSNVFNTMIAVPALTYVLVHLQKIGPNGRIQLSEDDKIWYDCIKRALLETFKIDLEDSAFDNKDSFVMAQQLINGPLDKALIELAGGTE